MPLLLVWTLAPVAAGCAANGADGATPAADRTAPVLLVDADAHGAIVLDGGERRYMGVRRDGTVAWRAPQGGEAPDAVRCLARCPDALLSGSSRSADSPDLAEPEAALVIDGRWTGLTGRERPRRYTVLAASGVVDDVLALTGDRTGWWLEAGGSPPQRTPVGGFRASWQQSRAGGRGLAVVAGSRPGHGEAHWFTRERDRWRRFGPGRPVTGWASCIAPDGGQAVILGGPPAVLLPDGRTEAVTDLGYASDCAFARDGGIVGEYGQGTAGAKARLRGFDRHGTVVWRADLRGSVRVTADPISASVGYLHNDMFTEISLVSGTVSRRINDVWSVRYDGSGALVVVRPDRSVRWERAG